MIERVPSLLLYNIDKPTVVMNVVSVCCRVDFTSVGSFGQDDVKYSSPSMYTLNPPPPPSTRPPPLLQQQSEQLNKSLPANLHNYYAAIDIIKVRFRRPQAPRLQSAAGPRSRFLIVFFPSGCCRRSARSSISRRVCSRAWSCRKTNRTSAVRRRCTRYLGTDYEWSKN